MSNNVESSNGLQPKIHSLNSEPLFFLDPQGNREILFPTTKGVFFEDISKAVKYGPENPGEVEEFIIGDIYWVDMNALVAYFKRKKEFRDVSEDQIRLDLEKAIKITDQQTEVVNGILVRRVVKVIPAGSHDFEWGIPGRLDLDLRGPEGYVLIGGEKIRIRKLVDLVKDNLIDLAQEGQPVTYEPSTLGEQVSEYAKDLGAFAVGGTALLVLILVAVHINNYRKITRTRNRERREEARKRMRRDQENYNLRKKYKRLRKKAKNKIEKDKLREEARKKNLEGAQFRQQEQLNMHSHQIRDLFNRIMDLYKRTEE